MEKIALFKNVGGTKILGDMTCFIETIKRRRVMKTVFMTRLLFTVSKLVQTIIEKLLLKASLY